MSRSLVSALSGRTARPALPGLLRAAARGAGAGLFATVSMSAAMLALQRVGALGRMPPQIITDDALRAAGVKGVAPRAVEKASGVIAHFGFGAVAAALFEVARNAKEQRRSPIAALLPTMAPRRRTPYAAGMAFGGLVWAVSYMGWVPALGILPPPQRDRPARPIAMILTHLVYGAALARGLG